MPNANGLHTQNTASRLEEGGKQMSETFLLGALLAVAGGFLDAYTYLLRGGVFANAQTGNIVLLGVNAAQGNWRGAVYYLIPIAAFVAGVVTAELVRSRFSGRAGIHWRQIILAAEMLILAGVAFLPRGDTDMLANVLVSYICSIQVESFRTLNGSSYATTMCTGNLRSGTELLYLYCKSGDKRERNRGMQYFGIIGFFVLGAALGVLGAGLLEQWAVLLCLGPLAVAFAVMFVRR